MNRLKERKDRILFAAVADYIRTGSPVSSDDVRKRWRFTESPATIRNELADLSDAGYLEQPHTSAGRVPTDRGYRWYVDHLDETEYGLAGSELRLIQELAERFGDWDDFFRASTELFAESIEALVVGGALADDSEPFYKSGFREILSQPEFTNLDIRHRFGELIDSIDAEMRALIESQDFSKPQVFIGKENPIREAAPYSMIVKTIAHDDAEGVIAILGAKRMHYDKGLLLLSSIDEFLKE